MATRDRTMVLAAVAALIASIAFGSVDPTKKASPVFGVTLPASYRDWRVISVAHEAGSLNDIRVILGNDIAVDTFRRGKRPFADGAIIARLAWKYVPSAQNNAIFDQTQSFVAGDPTNVQIERKDAKRFASTSGWGYGQFEGGKPNQSDALIRTCHACHVRLPASDDLIFTRYAR